MAHRQGRYDLLDDHRFRLARTADAERAAYLGACVDVIAAARQADGCCDFYLAADPIESDRINVYERWATVEAVENFHGSGSDDQLGSMIVAGRFDARSLRPRRSRSTVSSAL